MLKTPPDLAAKQSAGSPAMLDWMNPVDGEIDHEADAEPGHGCVAVTLVLRSFTDEAEVTRQPPDKSVSLDPADCFHVWLGWPWEQVFNCTKLVLAL